MHAARENGVCCERFTLEAFNAREIEAKEAEIQHLNNAWEEEEERVLQTVQVILVRRVASA